MQGLNPVNLDFDSVANEDMGKLSLLVIWIFVLARDCPIDDSIVTAMAVSSQITCHDGKTNTSNLLYLRTMATTIEDIKLALAHDAQCASDRTIAIVAQAAAYEAILGDLEVYRIHMQAVVAMVHLRGGLDALGMDGLVRRFLLWVDSNISLIIGCPHFFKSAELHPQPNPRQFAYGCYCAIQNLSNMGWPH